MVLELLFSMMAADSVPVDEPNMKRIQINLNVKEWRVNDYGRK